MEKSVNRLKYVREIPLILKSIKSKNGSIDQLINNLVKEFENNEYFYHYTKAIKDFDTNEEKLVFILTELTKERETCNQMIEIFNKCDQNEVSERLTEFNTSPSPMGLRTDIKIPVTRALAPKVMLSNTYYLMNKPRGLCVIINTVEKPQSPGDRHGLKPESDRFAHIFTELQFEIINLSSKGLSAKQIEKELIKIRSEKRLEKSDAFVLIVISHGEDDQVFGYNACEVMRKIRFSQITDNLETQYELHYDRIGIEKLVQIFSEDECKHLKSKPKLYFFICCRDISANNMTVPDLNCGEDNLVKLSSWNDPANKFKHSNKDNTDTFVSYSVAEGCKSFYSSDWGMTYFGQALTHAIAQYACDEPLQDIMNIRTTERLKELYSWIKQMCDENYQNGTGPKFDIDPGCFAIEVKTYSLKRKIYFNNYS